MTQHNNNLSLHQQGKDVALLQSQLSNIGYTIATSEILGELFGESTQQAVIQFQQAERLPVTGSVDGATAQAIVSSFEAGKTVIKHTPLPIHLPVSLVLLAISEGVLGKPIEVVSDQQVAAGSSLFLSCGMQGEDIKHLHNELQTLGYAISVEERQEALFGATTLGPRRCFNSGTLWSGAAWSMSKSPCCSSGGLGWRWHRSAPAMSSFCPRSDDRDWAHLV